MRVHANINQQKGWAKPMSNIIKTLLEDEEITEDFVFNLFQSYWNNSDAEEFSELLDPEGLSEMSLVNVALSMGQGDEESQRLEVVIVLSMFFVSDNEPEGQFTEALIKRAFEQDFRGGPFNWSED
jgi:hypothetical protein